MPKQFVKNKIKVCLVSISLGKGGSDRSCAHLSQLLNKEGFEVHIAVLNDSVHFKYSGKLLNLGKLKNNKDSLTKRFFRLYKLRQYLKKEQIDFVIDHRAKNEFFREWLYKNFVYRGRKIVYVVHSFKLQTYFGSAPFRISNLYQDNFATVCVSKAIKEHLENQFQLKNLTTIYNAVDARWAKLATETVKLPFEKYILAYGRIDDEVKDFSFLIASYLQSGVFKAGYKLVLLGDGKDKQKLMNYVESCNAKESVHFLPFTQNPFPYIKNAHITTLTSKWEGFPLVLLESLSLGIPVVSMDIESGPSEVIVPRKNGLLVKKRDVLLFAEALKELCLDENLHSECSDYAPMSVANFSEEKISTQWKKLLLYEK